MPIVANPIGRASSASALGVVGGHAGCPLDRAARPVRRPGGGRGGEARRIVAHLVARAPGSALDHLYAQGSDPLERPLSLQSGRCHSISQQKMTLSQQKMSLHFTAEDVTPLHRRRWPFHSNQAHNPRFAPPRIRPPIRALIRAYPRASAPYKCADPRYPRLNQKGRRGSALSARLCSNPRADSALSAFRAFRASPELPRGADCALGYSKVFAHNDASSVHFPHALSRNHYT